MSPDEQDLWNYLWQVGWKPIAYGRKYDGVRFAVGGAPYRGVELDPISKEVYGKKFEDWLNARYHASDRKNADFCSILAK
jgi:hypothetical protein